MMTRHSLLAGMAAPCIAALLSACTPAQPAAPPPAASAAPAPPATAAATPASSDSDTVTVRARVLAVNHSTREIRLRGPAGNVDTVVAGDDVRNFERIRRGDDVVITYHQSVAYSLSGPDASVPSATMTERVSQAPEGAMPGGTVARRITITGLVAGVDLAAHTISLVDQRGGAVHTFNVVNPQRQEDLKRVKVGDRLSVIFSQAIAISVVPAGRA